MTAHASEKGGQAVILLAKMEKLMHSSLTNAGFLGTLTTIEIMSLSLPDRDMCYKGW